MREPKGPVVRKATYPGISKALMMALDDMRVAYLIKGGGGMFFVHLFAIQPEKDHDQLLEHETCVGIEGIEHIKWVGMAISSTTLICWGVLDKPKKTKVCERHLKYFLKLLTRLALCLSSGYGTKGQSGANTHRSSERHRIPG